GEERVPLIEPPLVEQRGLLVQEVLHLSAREIGGRERQPNGLHAAGLRPPSARCAKLADTPPRAPWAPRAPATGARTRASGAPRSRVASGSGGRARCRSTRSVCPGSRAGTTRGPR